MSSTVCVKFLSKYCSSCNSTKANMSWYQTLDPSNSFREGVRVGRNGNGYHDVTIYYTVYQRGRGEFSITDGGTIIRETPDGTSRKLRVETRYGERFSITRRRGNGGYFLNTGGFWINELGRTYF